MEILFILLQILIAIALIISAFTHQWGLMLIFIIAVGSLTTFYRTRFKK